MKTTAIGLLIMILLTACGTNPPLATATLVAPSPSPVATTLVPPTEVVATKVPASTQDAVIVLKIVPDESSLTYEVGETFINQNNRFATAIGMTSEINGEIFANPVDPTQSKLGVITVDISTLTSDNTRRDNAIRRDWLESNTYPLVTFVPRSITNLPESYTPGEPYTFQVQGELTIKQTTLAAEFTVTASFDDQELRGTAESEFKMSDFNIGPISVAGILNTEDLVKVKLDFVARP